MFNLQSRQPFPSVPVLLERWRRCLLVGFLYYCLTSLIVGIAVLFGTALVEPAPGNPLENGVAEAFARGDGEFYKLIADKGYDYKPSRGSSVAFFPAFPLSGRGVSLLTGCSTALALVIVANLALACTFVVLVAYLQERFPDESPSM